METVTKIATFMHTADKAFWHEKMATNRYFATVSVLFALLSGIVTDQANGGVRKWLADSFLKWDVYPSLLAALGVLFLLITLNIGESIMSAKNVVSALLRSLWVTLVISIFFIVGIKCQQVATVILILLTVVLLIEMLLSLATATRKTLKQCN